MSQKLKVAIFGFGATGAFIQKACNDRKIYPTVFTDKINFIQPGAFFIHEIPGPMMDEAYRYRISIRVFSIGLKSVYNRRQGFLESYDSSFQQGMDLDKAVYVGDILQEIAYGAGRTHITCKLTDESCIRLSHSFDISFLTFPLQVDTHKFGDKKFWVPVVVGKSDERNCTNYILYNGTSEFPFVRQTKIFNNIYEEYPRDFTASEIQDLAKNTYGDTGDILHIPDLDPDVLPVETVVYKGKNLHLIGRWAEWNRHMLAHEAYDKTAILVDKLL
jgi:hypothetical protein